MFGQPTTPFSPSPEEEQAFLDAQQAQEAPSPYYAQPAYWADVLARGLQPAAPAQQPVVVYEEPTPIWVWALGGAAVVLIIRALK